MERSDKQRKPVAIKNLAELKRFIQPGVEFKTLSQKNHPDLVGLTRVVTTVQTVCFYSKIKDQPNSRFSTDNGGKGFRTDFKYRHRGWCLPPGWDKGSCLFAHQKDRQRLLQNTASAQCSAGNLYQVPPE